MEDHDISTKEGKREFIIALMDGIKHSLLARVEKMPESWDGHELRWLIAEYAADHAIMGLNKKSSRYKAYKNNCNVKNIY